MTHFKDLNLLSPIQKALDDLGYETPTPIQQQAIPPALLGKDILGCAQTGTGKTAAFAIPILQSLVKHRNQNNRKNIKALIVTPTRELAIQIYESFMDYGKYLPLKYAVIFGGVNQNPQVGKLRNGVDILVATPGRLLDLCNQKIISLKDIEIFVLDEADRMLDMGFIHDVKKLLQLLPQKRQSLFFSATMPKPIQELSNTILHQPVKVEVTPESTTAETIQQAIYYVDKENKIKLLDNLIKNQIKESVLVFTRTKYGADKLVKALTKLNISGAAIHGNKSQNARQNALNNFKNKKIQVLVATDIAARGIDIDLLKYVINFEVPNIPETYVHRIGRGGRAGAEGIAITLCDIDEKEYIKDIQKTIGLKIPEAENNPYPMRNFELTPPKPKQPRPQRRFKENSDNKLKPKPTKFRKR
ncbi:MAG: DEAD/DEAH box helicase [Weeksellaceae bacterium]|jgi:ATP-dependent RNA helicase RhlE|nr:DEAD/DEAH box helicase [Weeksellaceae bacterium]